MELISSLPSSKHQPLLLFSRRRCHLCLRSTAKSRVLRLRSAGVREELRRDAEETLEWNSVCRQVAAFTSTSAAREACLSGGLTIGKNRGESERLLEQTRAATALPCRIGFAGVEDVSSAVAAAGTGGVLGVRELCAVGRSLRGARRAYEELIGVSSRDKEVHERYSSLLDIFGNCNFLTELVHRIEFCIDGNLSVILNQASPRLESIRSERRQNADTLESLLKGISSKIFQAGGIDSPLVTKRRSRMCVGIRASHKSLLPDGIILGVSSSGATFFIEPREAIDLNNMEVWLSNSEMAEELAILSMLTSCIALSSLDITYLMERIQELDLAIARGYHALWINGVCPVFDEVLEDNEINENQEGLLVDIESICHPLLLESSLKNPPALPAIESEPKNSNKINDQVNYRPLSEGTVVPLDVKIRKNSKVVVISGPNTGGKTVAMKTLGLASLMSKAGLFLPAKNCPRLPWFDHILADIGDNQSLEHNLSTFSGHMSRISKILEVSTRQSLVLIDEIGNGTDPSEGVALSISILQHIVNVVSLAVVTTHYTDLTILKAKDHQFENAAMEFCMETLQPTYRILWGSTGNSNALNIAKAIGFDQEVLNHAEKWVQKLLPDKQDERHGLLYESLLEERNLLQAQATKAASVLSEVEKLYHEISTEAEDLDRREAALKARESRRVHHELKAVKSQMDLIVKNFERQLQDANPDQFNSLMRQAESAITNIVDANCMIEDSSLGKASSSTPYVPQVGDQVRVNGLGDKLAIIIGEPGDDGRVLVQYGKIRVRVKSSEMELIRSSGKISVREAVLPSRMQERRRGTKLLTMEETEKDQGPQYAPAVQTSKNTVDLRGMRVEEASNHLNMAISGCRSYGVLFIIHGMGTGAVKECALTILKKHPRVTRFEEESPMNYGCTVAYIK